MIPHIVEGMKRVGKGDSAPPPARPAKIAASCMCGSTPFWRIRTATTQTANRLTPVNATIMIQSALPGMLPRIYQTQWLLLELTFKEEEWASYKVHSGKAGM